MLCFHPVNRLSAAKYEGRASVADDDGVAAVAEIYSIPTATSTARIYRMPLQAPVRPVLGATELHRLNFFIFNTFLKKLILAPIFLYLTLLAALHARGQHFNFAAPRVEERQGY
jgi:hypothetical protein